jgi:hypothetical protein
MRIGKGALSDSSEFQRIYLIVRWWDVVAGDNQKGADHPERSNFLITSSPAISNDNGDRF